MELWTLKNEQDLKDVWSKYQDCYVDEDYPTEYPCCMVVHQVPNNNGSKDWYYAKFVYKSDFD